MVCMRNYRGKSPQKPDEKYKFRFLWEDQAAVPGIIKKCSGIGKNIKLTEGRTECHIFLTVN